MLLCVKAGTKLKECAWVGALHVFNANDRCAALQVHRHRSIRGSEIEPIVSKARVKIPWAADQKAVGVFEPIFSRILRPKASAMIQVARKGIGRSRLEDIERDVLVGCCGRDRRFASGEGYRNG